MLNSSLTCHTENSTLVPIPAPRFDVSYLHKVVILTALGSAAFICNVLTLLSIRKRNRNCSTMYELIKQLAIADILVALSGLITEGIWTYTVEWHAGGVMCKLIKYSQMFSLYASTFVTVLIGIDRMTAVIYPLHKETIKKRFKMSIMFVWILSAILSIPQVSTLIAQPFLVLS
ncbi:GPRGNR2 (predicted) [Pycnogonum litorale]